MKFQFTTIVFLLFFSISFSNAQPVTNNVCKEKIKKLNFLSGEWDGDAMVRFSPTEEYPFTIHESASFKLDSTAFYIEGIAKMSIAGQERIVGQGLGIITYDAKTGEYKMWHCESDGSTFMTTVTVENNKMDYYSTNTEGLKLHVKIIVEPDGRWLETVDRYEEGKGWQLFREYTFTRLR